MLRPAVGAWALTMASLGWGPAVVAAAPVSVAAHTHSDAKAPRVSVRTSYLQIRWPEFLRQSDVDAAKAKELAGAACKQIGQALTVGKGLWGTGLFDDFGCVSAKDPRTLLAGHAAKSEPAWMLSFGQTGTSVTLRIMLNPAKLGGLGADHPVAPVEVGVLKLDASPYLQDLMRDQRYSQLLAAALLDTMPAAMRLTAALNGDAGDSDQLVHQSTPPGHAVGKAGKPKRMRLFTWQILPESGIWTAHVVGSAKLTRRDKTSGWLVKRNTQETTAHEVYGQRSGGPEQAVKPLLQALAARQKVILEDRNDQGFADIREGLGKTMRFLTIDSIASGFIGARYSYELVDPNTAFFTPGSILGLVAEFRSGFLDGLRLYFDYAPLHRRTVSGDTFYLTWDRYVAGWGFAFPMPWLVDRIELTPKLGLWSIDARLPDLDDQGNPVGRTFKASGLFSAGLELSAEWEGPWYLGRLWHARDLSTPLSRVGGMTRNVYSARTGFDAVIKGPPVGLFGRDWHLGFLIFGYYEDMTFDEKAKNGNRFEFIYSTAYAGGGLSLAW
ncbi:MAG: hypothetical protein NTZ90_07955 [Proteobacteria bacterium]|nr:hypothetical protein [Pseudomonadota bacterium]